MHSLICAAGLADSGKPTSFPDCFLLPHEAPQCKRYFLNLFDTDSTVHVVAIPQAWRLAHCFPAVAPPSCCSRHSNPNMAISLKP